ncbi:type IV pilin N-terminal domain-containing protein [Methanorbis rubei]|uniref:Archaeal Type IV pilin N-terminal domain-containing protein n=1 Tax=Methanorbis rubei TaxID=3028300 RepID=A0AAE4MFK4_9EURY|nr:hypothetical protein [Methanocorpusculaceae archaeon Cs1]
MSCDTSDNAITSVVGEMLILVLVIILVSLFATSAFNLLPGDRETVATVSMSHNDSHLIFWHKGGDWVDKKDLTITATPKAGGDRITLPIDEVSDYSGSPVEVFDLGGSITTKTENLSEGVVYEIRVTTPKNVIYAREFTR